MPPPPAEIAYLADRIGAAATLRLIEARGGTRVYIPHVAKKKSELAREIGITAAAALSAWRGGEVLLVPNCKPWRARVYRAQGCTHREIARRLVVHESTVERYLTGRLPTSQLELSLS